MSSRKYITTGPDDSLLAKGNVIEHHEKNIYIINGKFYYVRAAYVRGLIPYDSLTEKEKFMFELAGIIPGRLL